MIVTGKLLGLNGTCTVTCGNMGNSVCCDSLHAISTTLCWFRGCSAVICVTEVGKKDTGTAIAYALVDARWTFKHS